MFSVLVTFYGAKLIEKISNRIMARIILTIVITLDLSMLVLLKYFSFWTSKYNLIVPLGISFYTLSIIGYIVDVSKKRYSPEKNFLIFLLYVSYFPHILQGPIARYNQLGEQFKVYHHFDYVRIARGCQLMIWGYIKKMIIADRAAIFVDTVYSQINTVNGTLLFIASILYSIQIYADFSGCVDIAIGVSEVLGIELRDNFKQPYLSNSINDFWKKWHISLSSWFRDYLYIPLGGNRKGIVRRWINVLFVFTISGFWHGVGVNYILWGLIHGLYQVIGYLLQPFRKRIARIFILNEDIFGLRVIKILCTFLLVNFAWVFFRVTDLSDVIFIFKSMFTEIAPWVLTDGSLYLYGLSQKSFMLLLIWIGILFVVDILHEKQISIRSEIDKEPLFIRWSIYLSAVYSVLLFGIYGIGYDASSFIYMNF